LNELIFIVIDCYTYYMMSSTDSLAEDKGHRVILLSWKSMSQCWLQFHKNIRLQTLFFFDFCGIVHILDIIYLFRAWYCPITPWYLYIFLRSYITVFRPEYAWNIAHRTLSYPLSFVYFLPPIRNWFMFVDLYSEA